MPIVPARWIAFIVGIIFFLLYVRRSLEVGPGVAAREIGESIGSFGTGLGAVGRGIGELGVGIGVATKATLDPFGIVSRIVSGIAIPEQRQLSQPESRNVTSVPAGATGGYSVRQGMAESTPSTRPPLIPPVPPKYIPRVIE